MVSLGLRAVSVLTARLPLALVYWVAALLADRVFPLLRQKRRNALENMAHVLGPAASPELVELAVQEVGRNYARYLVDFLRMRSTTREDLERRIRAPDWSVLDEARAGGRGAIFVGMHMGSWDLGAACLALRGYPVHAIVDTFKHPHHNAYIQSTRSQTGLRLIPVQQAPRRALQVLRQGEILGMLIDRPLAGEGVPVQFFGETVYLPAGAAALALRTGAPVFAMSILRRSDHTFEGVMSPAMTVEPSGNPRRDVQALTQRIVAEFEATIRQHPDQWYMFRPMWQGADHPEAAWELAVAQAEAAK